MNTLYIMVGRPFSGKTTLRKKLVKRFGFSVASVDWEIDNRGLKVSEMTQKDWDIVYSETYEKLKELLKEDKTVILDLGNLKKSERKVARGIAEEFGVPHKTIYIDTPLEEVKKRWAESQRSPEGRKMDEEVFERGQTMFEEPIDEGVIVFNAQMNLEEWIDKNITSGK